MTTHPSVVAAVAQLVKEAGGEIFLGDSPSVGSLENAARASGIGAVVREFDIKLVPFKRPTPVKTGESGPLREVEIAGEVLDCDVLINLPKMKTHAHMFLTLAVKNLFGCVVGPRKLQWHLKAGSDYEHFARMLVHIARAAKPALNIIDGVVAMEGNGPQAGQLRDIGVIAASADAVALDAVVTKMLGFDPDAVYTTRAAREIGWGTPRVEDIEIAGVNIADVSVKDFVPPRKGDLILPVPQFVKRALRRLFTSRPRVDAKKCRLCGECAKICPAQAISIDKKVIIDHGRCIRCFCCQEMCPWQAIDVRDGLLVRLIHR